MNEEAAHGIEDLLETADLVDALKHDRFKGLLDRIPVAILLSSMKGAERIIYSNPAFEKLTGQGIDQLDGRGWEALDGKGEKDGRKLAAAITEDSDHIGVFRIERAGSGPVLVDCYASVIETDDAVAAFRLVALIDITAYVQSEREHYEQRIRDSDLMLLELQHRVKNNLQMITALIRLEARTSSEGSEMLNRIAGRVEALTILHQFLSADAGAKEVDLGAYVSQVASAVMKSHPLEGIKLKLQVEVHPVSINIALPTGLVINELMTNALKHAFRGRDSGTISLECVSSDRGWKVVVADDGVGLPPGVRWPENGNLGALIVESLRENANAELTVASHPGQGTCVTLLFAGRGAKSMPQDRG